MTDTRTITLGQDEHDQSVNLSLDSLMRSRALIQGASGSGKSYLARLIVEQAGHHVPVIVIDPEGEYATLRELHQRWLGSKALSRPQAVLLEILLKELSAMSREDLADRAGVSAWSSGFEKNVSRLSSLGLVRYPQPGVVELTELLFPEGLR